MDRRHLLAAALAFTSLALAIAGLVVWREMSPPFADFPDGHRLLVAFPPPYRLHPLRAELLWAAASVTGLIAVGLTLRPYAGRDRTLSASG